MTNEQATLEASVINEMAIDQIEEVVAPAFLLDD
jgi:hypothetical protein